MTRVTFSSETALPDKINSLLLRPEEAFEDLSFQIWGFVERGSSDHDLYIHEILREASDVNCHSESRRIWDVDLAVLVRLQMIRCEVHGKLFRRCRVLAYRVLR